jgi:Helix-turn-helix domain
MSIHSCGLGDDEPLVVSPRRAQLMLDIAVARLYELINSNELESYKCGKSRKITVASIKRYIERRIAAAA